VIRATACGADQVLVPKRRSAFPNDVGNAEGQRSGLWPRTAVDMPEVSHHQVDLYICGLMSGNGDEGNIGGVGVFELSGCAGNWATLGGKPSRHGSSPAQPSPAQPGPARPGPARPGQPLSRSGASPAARSPVAT
jgi:hypothetical protein